LITVLDVTLQTAGGSCMYLAATVWVRGQLSLAGLVPGLRRISPSAPRAVGRRFAQIAWPAYGALIATGIWNVLAVHATWRGAYGVWNRATTAESAAITLIVKIAVVAVSGISAWAHGRSRSRSGSPSGARSVSSCAVEQLL